MTPTKTCPQCGARYGAEQRFCARDGASLRGEAASGTLVGEVLADRYLVQERLGEGGMGEVYRAEHVRMRRPCAVKVLRPAVAADPDAVSRFNREAANASRVSHPNVATVYDFGETPEGLIYLAMELVEGRSLRALLDERGALPPARALALVAQIAAALDAAHALGIVHRDLKPDNVMLAHAADDADVVKVVDFGIAKGADAPAQQVTRTGLIVGTPEFMSPEQLAGDPVDARSDVYALALLAYAMLTGAHPFPAETVQDTLVLRLTTEPRRLSELRPDVPWPSEVQAVLDRGLARRAAERTPTAGELARTLASAYETAASGVSAAATSPDAATQILPASAVALPPTRVAPARAPAPRRRSRTAVAAGGIGVAALLALATWRVRGPATATPPAAAKSTTVAPFTTDASARGPASTGESAPPEPLPSAPVPPPAAGRPPTPLATVASAGSAAAPSGPATVTGDRAPSLDDSHRDAPDAERPAEADTRLGRIERLLQMDDRDPDALADALRTAERTLREAAPTTRTWYRAQVGRSLVLLALDDVRGCDAMRVVAPHHVVDAVRDPIVRTMFEEFRRACPTLTARN